MGYYREKLQWAQLITVHHGAEHGHILRMETGRVGNRGFEVPLGHWKGLGVPESVMRTASGLIVAAFEEHLITRYGIQGEIPGVWAKEVGPF